MSFMGRAMGLAEPAGLFRAAEWWTRRRAPVVTYHRFRRDGDPWRGIHVADFERHLQLVADRFRPVLFGDMVQALGSSEPVSPRTVALTIDDGYADFHELALPLLVKYRVPATIFVVSGFLDGGWIWTDRVDRAVQTTERERLTLDFDHVHEDVALGEPRSRQRVIDRLWKAAKEMPGPRRLEFVGHIEDALGVPRMAHPSETYRPLSWPQVRECHRQGIEIGSHTHTHPILSRVDAAAQREELTVSKARIEEELQAPVRTLAYPNGGVSDFSQTTQEAVRAAGYTGAASTIYGFAEPAADLYAVRRMNARADFRGFRQTLSGLQALAHSLGAASV